MPWCHIDPEKLKFIEMFGYEILHQDDTKMLAHYSAHTCDMVISIVKTKPFLYFSEIEDAMQLGVIGIVQGPP